MITEDELETLTDYVADPEAKNRRFLEDRALYRVGPGGARAPSAEALVGVPPVHSIGSTGQLVAVSTEAARRRIQEQWPCLPAAQTRQKVGGRFAAPKHGGPANTRADDTRTRITSSASWIRSRASPLARLRCDGFKPCKVVRQDRHRSSGAPGSGAWIRPRRNWWLLARSVALIVSGSAPGGRPMVPWRYSIFAPMSQNLRH